MGILAMTQGQIQCMGPAFKKRIELQGKLQSLESWNVTSGRGPLYLIELPVPGNSFDLLKVTLSVRSC